MLLYSMLHLTGVKAVDPDYEVEGGSRSASTTSSASASCDSKAPGHPEYRWTLGVETTTGPALDRASRPRSGWRSPPVAGGAFNQTGFELFDFDVYAFAGDGCFMEGV